MGALVVTSDVAFQRIAPLAHPDAWDNLVGQHSEATIFHTSAWLRVLHESYGYEPFCWKFPGDNGADGLLPLMEVNSWLTGRRGISLPFTDHCSFLLGNQPNFQEAWKFLRLFARERGWRSIELRDFPQSEQGSGISPSLQFYQHLLSLDRDPARLFAAFDDSTRRAIRKSQKSGLSIGIEHGEDALAEYYRLHCLTRQKHGLPPQPFSFFRNIQRHIINRRLGFIALARQGDGARPVAGAVFFEHGRRAVYKFGSSDPAADNRRPNNAVMWTAIEHLCARGFHHLDFGRTSLQSEGLRRYKLGWGAREFTRQYIKWDLRDEAFVRAKDAAHGLHNRFFRRCPQYLSRALGKFLYPHIA